MKIKTWLIVAFFFFFSPILLFDKTVSISARLQWCWKPWQSGGWAWTPSACHHLAAHWGLAVQPKASSYFTLSNVGSSPRALQLLRSGDCHLMAIGNGAVGWGSRQRYSGTRGPSQHRPCAAPEGNHGPNSWKFTKIKGDKQSVLHGEGSFNPIPWFHRNSRTQRYCNNH